MSEQVSKTEGLLNLLLSWLRVVQCFSLPIDLLFGFELVLFNSLHLHALLRIERLAFDEAKELLQVLIHKEAVDADARRRVKLVFSRVERVLSFGLQTGHACHLGSSDQLLVLVLRQVSDLGDHHTLGKAAHDSSEALFLSVHFEELLEDELGGADHIDADHDGHAESQKTKHEKRGERDLLHFNEHVESQGQANQEDQQDWKGLIQSLKRQNCQEKVGSKDPTGGDQQVWYREDRVNGEFAYLDDCNDPCQNPDVVVGVLGEQESGDNDYDHNDILAAHNDAIRCQLVIARLRGHSCIIVL